MSEPIPSSTEGGKLFRAGTLTYTKAALFSLFAWLLWGDFCFVLMEAAAPAVPQGADISIEKSGDRVTLRLPKFSCHQMIEIEC